MNTMNRLKTVNTRGILSQFGLEPRRTAATKVGGMMSMLGLGAALGAGAMFASRLPPVRKFFARLPKAVGHAVKPVEHAEKPRAVKSA
ncbi:MAG: hypothetical protein Q8K32_32960 [Archangium sp.]|nr:hypothetical protein [Archangium sp.]